MSDTQRTYRIEIVAQGDPPVEWFDSADAAMEAIIRNQALRVGQIVIQDDTGAVLTTRQLALLVMNAQLQGI